MADSAYGLFEGCAQIGIAVGFTAHRVGNVDTLRFSAWPKYGFEGHVEVASGGGDAKAKL